MSADMGFFPRVEISVVNKPSVFEPLKFYCNFFCFFLPFLSWSNRFCQINGKFAVRPASLATYLFAMTQGDLD